MKWENILEKLQKAVSKVGKKTIVTVCTIAVLGCMVVLNVILFSGGGDDTPKGLQPALDLSAAPGTSDTAGELNAAQVNDYFQAMALNRKQARDEAIEVLLTVAESENALEEAKQSALHDMSKLASEIETESDIEAMILAKGFTQCIAVISNDTCNVIVESDGLDPGEVAQITEIVYEQSGIDPTRLTIIEKNTKTEA